MIGDVHGAYDLVWQAMQKAGFDPRVDRLFSVGDLVDRGAQSMRAKRFLGLPYVAAARGNHEDWWLSLYEGGSPEPEVVGALGARMKMGVQWWLDADPMERDELVAMFRSLPLAIEIETDRGSVGIVHGDVPAGMSWQDFKAALERGDEKVVKTALWGRSRIRGGDQTGVQGIGRVFVGHTPQWNGLKSFGNVYAIDTGAVFGMTGNAEPGEGRLTMAQLIAGTQSLKDSATLQGGNVLVDVRVAGRSAIGPFGSSTVGRST